MMKTVPSGGFAADRFFDGTDVHPVVAGQLAHRIARLVPFPDHRSGNAGADDKRPAERDQRVYHYEPGRGFQPLIAGAEPGERIEPHGDAVRITLNALQVRSGDLFHGDLALLRGVDQFAVALHKKVKAVGLETHVDQRPLDREVATYVFERRTYGEKRPARVRPRDRAGGRVSGCPEQLPLSAWPRPASAWPSGSGRSRSPIPGVRRRNPAPEPRVWP